jgi:ligand-binding sensor domain-containing protein
LILLGATFNHGILSLNMMKRLIIVLLGILSFSGCNIITEKEELILNPEIDFTISSHLAIGKEITSIVAIDENNYFYSIGNEIFCIENSRENHMSATSKVLAMAWNDIGKVLWFGTWSSGLARFKDGKISYFTQISNNLPRDLVSDLVCDCNGTVWFSSSAHLLGGLGRYMNGGFKFYAPGNSSLPDNLIKSIACVGDRIFVATGGTVTQQKVVEIDGNKWKLLPVAGYYLMDMDVDREGRVYVIDDVGLSSSSNSTNKIYLFDNDNYRNILTDGSWPHCLKTDLRNYLWVSKSGPENSGNLTVYDGKSWHEVPFGFPEMFINCISVDKDNAIWLGTTDGIYMLKQ